ncbi:MAG TPA: site-specific DNA-methyltransferase [Pyrinomonadaceae bacterium]|nr:site-specific DNA-methyltransferase [Pyrinomonadaceae bacterium]
MNSGLSPVVTSPPYWRLRDYGIAAQLGREATPYMYVQNLLKVFNEIRRVLKPSGTCWVVIGDRYFSSNNDLKKRVRSNSFLNLSKRERFEELKTIFHIPLTSLCMLPSRFALGMMKKGWILRNELIWHKPNAMPQSSRDRFTVDFEKVFFFVKSKGYYFKQQYEPLKESGKSVSRFNEPQRPHKKNDSYWFDRPKEQREKAREKMLSRGRIKRCVWSIGKACFKGNHFAVFPEKLIETPILAGCPEGGIVLDPFMGSGTTGMVAKRLGRKYIGIELNPAYANLARYRIEGTDTDEDEPIAEIVTSSP